MIIHAVYHPSFADSWYKNVRGHSKMPAVVQNVWEFRPGNLFQGTSIGTLDKNVWGRRTRQQTRTQRQQARLDEMPKS